MKIGIIGAGAIGLHLSAQLHMAGSIVTLLCRTAEQAKQLEIRGLTYEGISGECEKLSINTYAGQTNEQFDVLILAVKQTHLYHTIPTLKKLINERTLLLCFQNGLGHDEILRNEFPEVSLFLAVTTEGALKTSETSVRHTGRGETWIGSVNTHKVVKNKNSVDQLVKLFSNTELTMREANNIYGRIWRKLLVNTCINPLTAIYKLQNGALIESPSAMALMQKVFKEGQTVANSQGIIIKEDFFHEILKVCRNTSFNRSSMLQDIEAGRTTEIDFINGAIKRVAAREGIDVPANDMLVEMVRAAEEWAIKKQ